MFIAPIRL